MAIAFEKGENLELSFAVSVMRTRKKRTEPCDYRLSLMMADHRPAATREKPDLTMQVRRFVGELFAEIYKGYAETDSGEAIYQEERTLVHLTNQTLKETGLSVLRVVFTGWDTPDDSYTEPENTAAY